MILKSICILLPEWITSHMGGAEWQSYLLSEELFRRGWQIEIVTRTSRLNNPQYINPSNRYIFYNTNRSKFITFILILISLMKTNSDYYYVRTDSKILKGACRIYTWLKRRKMIYAIASDNDALNKSLINYKYQYSKTNLTNIVKYLLKMIDAVLTSIFIKWGNNANLIICQTYKQQSLFKLNTNKDSKVISNSSGMTFKTSNNDSAIKCNIVLWIGNIRNLNDICNVKRPEVFLECARKCKGKPWKFVMIGRGTENIQHNLDNLFLLGEIDKDDLLLWYKKAKIYVNTSILEGYPNTFIEAALSNCLIISLSVDIDCILEKDNLGLVCNNNLIQLTQKLRSAIDEYDSEYINEMKKRSFNFFQEGTSIENNTKKLLNYLELL